HVDYPHHHPFPTRRSSDLAVESVTIRTTHRVYGPSRATDVVPQFEPQHASHTLTAMTPDLPAGVPSPMAQAAILGGFLGFQSLEDRKSTRLNSSHVAISYA